MGRSTLMESLDDRVLTLARRNLRTLGPVIRDEIVELFVTLPVELDLLDGRTMLFQSSFTALLGDARRATGRDERGEVKLRHERGSWLGLLGYLSLVDQISKVFASANADPHSYVATLMDRGSLTTNEAEALYGVRNAMAHGFGIANKPERNNHQRFRFRYALSTVGPLVTLPGRRWDGGTSRSSVEGATTSINVSAVAELVEDIAARLRADIRDGRPPPLVDGMNALTLRANYFFSISSPSRGVPMASAMPPPESFDS